MVGGCCSVRQCCSDNYGRHYGKYCRVRGGGYSGHKKIQEKIIFGLLKLRGVKSTDNANGTLLHRAKNSK